MKYYSSMSRYAPRGSFRIMPASFGWDQGEPNFAQTTYQPNFRSINVFNPSSYGSGTAGFGRDIPSSGSVGLALRIPQYVINNAPIVKITNGESFVYICVSDKKLAIGTGLVSTGINTVSIVSTISAGVVDSWFFLDFSIAPGPMNVTVNGGSSFVGGVVPSGSRRFVIDATPSTYGGIRFADFKYEDDGQSGPVRTICSFTQQREASLGWTGSDDTSLRPPRIGCNWTGTSGGAAGDGEAIYAYNGNESTGDPVISPWRPDVPYTSIVGVQMDAFAGKSGSGSSGLSLRITHGITDTVEDVRSTVNSATLDRADVSLSLPVNPVGDVPWTIADIQSLKTTLWEKL